MNEIVTIVKLEDGSYGAQNRTDTSGLTKHDLACIASAMALWLDVHCMKLDPPHGEEIAEDTPMTYQVVVQGFWAPILAWLFRLPMSKRV